MCRFPSRCFHRNAASPEPEVPARYAQEKPHGYPGRQRFLGTTPYRVTLGDDSHQWLSDVPAALGGGDSGPLAARDPALGAGRLHGDHCGDVRAAQGVAAGGYRRATEHRRGTHQAGALHPYPPRHPPGRRSRRRAAPASAGDRQCLPDPSCTPERSASAASYATEPAHTSRSTA